MILAFESQNQKGWCFPKLRMDDLDCNIATTYLMFAVGEIHADHIEAS